MVWVGNLEGDYTREDGLWFAFGNKACLVTKLGCFVCGLREKEEQSLVVSFGV